jgi:hypothetical protein
MIAKVFCIGWLRISSINLSSWFQFLGVFSDAGKSATLKSSLSYIESPDLLGSLTSNSAKSGGGLERE